MNTDMLDALAGEILPPPDKTAPLDFLSLASTKLLKQPKSDMPVVRQNEPAKKMA